LSRPVKAASGKNLRADAQAGDQTAMRLYHQQYLGGEMVVVIDCSDLERSAAFWCGVLGYRRAGQPAGQYLGLLPVQGVGLELLLQRVEEGSRCEYSTHV